MVVTKKPFLYHNLCRPRNCAQAECFGSVTENGPTWLYINNDKKISASCEVCVGLHTVHFRQQVFVNAIPNVDSSVDERLPSIYDGSAASKITLARKLRETDRPIVRQQRQSVIDDDDI